MADRGRARVRMTGSATLGGRVVVRLRAVGERVHRGADGRVERQVERRARGRRSPRRASRARRIPPPFRPGPSSIPKYGVHSAPAYVVGTATIRGARSRLRRQLRGDGLAGVDGASAAERRRGRRRRARRRARPPPAPSRPGRAAGRRRTRRRRATVGRCRPPSRRHEQRALDLDLGEDAAELRQRSGTEPRDPDRRSSRARLPRGGRKPAPDATARSRANSANSCAARVGTRAVPRARTISRVPSIPSIRASDERTGGELGLDGGARDERDAEAREHRAPHRLLQAELEAHVEVAEPNAEPAQLVVDDPAHARALLHDDERLVRQLVGADRLAREAVTGRAHEHDLVVGERLELDTAVARRGADDAELELPLGDQVDHGPRVVHLERDPHGRVRALELAEELRHDDGGGAGRGADREHAREVALRLRRRRRRAPAPRARGAAARRGTGAGRPPSARRGVPTGRAAGCRAASRALAPGATRRAG